MNEKKFETLGAKRMGEAVSSNEDDLLELEKSIGGALPQGLKSVLSKYAGAVVFENGAKFKPAVKSPFADRDGYQGFEIIYGLGEGEHSVLLQQRRYAEQLAENFVVFGEAPGGNPICIELRTETVYFWNHEEDFSSGLYKVANSFSEFVELLEADVGNIGSTDGVVESESWLDF